MVGADSRRAFHERGSHASAVDAEPPAMKGTLDRPIDDSAADSEVSAVVGAVGAKDRGPAVLGPESDQCATEVVQVYDLAR
jgi:hypothetical protein